MTTEGQLSTTGDRTWRLPLAVHTVNAGPPSITS
jgi:hypothetical protein